MKDASIAQSNEDKMAVKIIAVIVPNQKQTCNSV
jgi:hypothetical protein